MLLQTVAPPNRRQRSATVTKRSNPRDDDGYAEENADLAEAFEIFKEAIEEDDDASEEDLKV